MPAGQGLAAPDRGRAGEPSVAQAASGIGRPWLDNQAHPFDLARTLQLAQVNPF